MTPSTQKEGILFYCERENCGHSEELHIETLGRRGNCAFRNLTSGCRCERYVVIIKPQIKKEEEWEREFDKELVRDDKDDPNRGLIYEDPEIIIDFIRTEIQTAKQNQLLE